MVLPAQRSHSPLQPEPNLTSRQVRRHAVPDALGIDPLHRISIVTRRVPLLREILDSACGRLTKIEDGGPLLNLLFVVLGRKRSVGAAMPNLHLRSRPGVPWIHIQNDFLPLIRRRPRLSTAARVIPLIDSPRRADETARRDAGVQGYGADEFRVRRGEHVRHHGARGAARHIDARRVHVVRLDGVENHVRDGLGVASA